jgi:rfaE bifunctional protein nucleotidyltransferase chain/domain
VNPEHLPENPKLFTLEKAASIRNRPEYHHQTIVLTNGCFDLLHPGHIFFLKEAAKLGSKLWVALNGDTSIQELKGSKRPILPEAFRAYSLAALDCVAGIFLFHSARLNHEIETFKPDVYVKAGDYTLDSLDRQEKHALDQVGAQINFLPFLEGFSTTGLIERIGEAK